MFFDIQEFSDWSDGSDGNEKNKPDGASNAEEKQVKSNVAKNDDDNTVDHDGSFEDVYDPISDDELEAIIADQRQESRVKETTQTLDIEDVDWSVLEKKTENGMALQKIIPLFILQASLQCPNFQ